MSKRTWPRACFCRRYREAHSEAAPSCFQRASRRRQCLLDTGHLHPHLHWCWLGAAPGSGQPLSPQATTRNCWGLPLRAALSSGSAWPGPTDPVSGHSPGHTAHGAARGRSHRLVETQQPPGSSPITPEDSGAKPEQGAARPDTSAPEQRVGTNASQPSSFPTPSSQHSRMEEKHEEPKTHAMTEGALITGPLHLLVYFLFTTGGSEAHACSRRASCVSHVFTDFSDQGLLIYPLRGVPISLSTSTKHCSTGATLTETSTIQLTVSLLPDPSPELLLTSKSPPDPSSSCHTLSVSSPSS